jgi:alpha-ketoglutarate-dependent 2,4-dichlorophenoxyacetate dioxygenase
LQTSISLHRADFKRRLARGELSDISNVDAEGNIIDPDDPRRAYNKPAQLWHTDSSFRAVPGGYTFLSPRLLPPSGGDTLFADCRTAYEALDDDTKAQIADLRVIHTLARSRELAGGQALSEEEERALPATEQPLVFRHPRNGRPALYLGSPAASVVGWPPEQGRALLDRLGDWATRDEFVFVQVWRPGDLVMWDNLATLHRATPYEDKVHRRDMRRTTVAARLTANAQENPSITA